jgi:predicted DNA-binding transcriptional regulator AlpA
MDEQFLRKGIDLDIDHTDRMLVGANNLAWCMDCDAATIHRWAKSGQMPKPLRVGNSVRWDVHEIRQWIDSGCPAVDRD